MTTRSKASRGDDKGDQGLSASRLDALLQFGEQLMQCDTLNNLHEELCRLVQDERVFGAEQVVILEGDSRSDVLFTVAGSSRRFHGVSWLRSERLDRVLNGQIVALKDASKLQLNRELLKSFDPPMQASLFVPLSNTKLLIAWHSQVAYFKREHVVLMSRFAPMASHMLKQLSMQQLQMQRLRVESERRVMREQFLLIKHAARSLGAGVAVLDTQGTLRESSDGLRELVNEWPSTEVWWDLARRVLSETPITGSEAIGEDFDPVETRHIAKRTVDMDDPSGIRRVFELTFTGTPHRFDGGELGHVLLVADVTRWILAEDALIDARDESERANKAKSRFLANMSHELRTPLNAIIGYSEMLLEESGWEEDGQCYEDLTKVHISAKQLLTLINDVLDLSKIEADRMSVSASNFSLTTLLEEVETTVHPMIKQGDNRFVRTDMDLPGSMCSDRDKIRQVLLNLLANAAKFTEKGMISLTVNSSFDETGSRWVEFKVSDTGIGIPEDKLGRLFTPFEQVDPSATRRYGGTGLGLAISQRLCRMLGGEIEVESRLGIGSSFSVHLPTNIGP